MSCGRPASHPWDRLCDALNGGGVYSVEEALSKLQIRPLLDALRQAVTPETIEAFGSVAYKVKPEAPEPITEADEEIPLLADEPGEDDATPDAVREVADESAAGPDLDPRLEDFVAKAHLFADRVAELFASDGRAADYEAVARKGDSPAGTDDCRVMAAATARLPEAVSAFPKALERSARVALPSELAGVNPAPVWAPTLAWLVFQTLNPRFSAIEVFERLNLRWALAETFSSVGLEGEAAWKAAAQVRVLLKYCEADAACTQTVEFWADPDVRWLAGVNTSKGVEYINRERFEELVCWCQLPALLRLASSAKFTAEQAAAVGAESGKLAQLLAEGGYKLAEFLELLKPEEPEAVSSAERLDEEELEEEWSGRLDSN